MNNTTPSDVQQGLDLWGKLNENPRTWASFEAEQFPTFRVVRVTHGSVIAGRKQTAIGTIKFDLKADGSVAVTRYTHS